MDTSTVTAAEIMTDRLSTTSPATHVRDAISLLISHGVSGLPFQRALQLQLLSFWIRKTQPTSRLGTQSRHLS